MIIKANKLKLNWIYVSSFILQVKDQNLRN